jgi:DNA-directed RNA polymerase subunit RPC12/RpoP
MPVLSHLHQLFNADQCQAYIHTLRWKDRPLQCPRCQSHTIGRWGTYHYRPGCQRYWCHSCKRTFNDLTETLLQALTTSPYPWTASAQPGLLTQPTQLRWRGVRSVHPVDPVCGAAITPPASPNRLNRLASLARA